MADGEHTTTTTIDLTRGVYKRIYANFIFGRRINAVSERAEMWFWRLLSVADDFGNLVGEPELVYGATAGRRTATVTMSQVWACVTELIEAGLLGSYVDGADTYLHVMGYLQNQAAGINGKRVRRLPASPWEDDELAQPSRQAPRPSKRPQANPRESKRIRANAGANQNSEPEPEARRSADADEDATASSAASLNPELSEAQNAARTRLNGPPVVMFQCSDGVLCIDQDTVDERQKTYAELNVLGELKALAEQVMEVPTKRVPKAEMPNRMYGWLRFARNNPGARVGAIVPTGSATGASLAKPNAITAKRAAWKEPVNA